jgi:Phage integrase family
MFDLASTDNVKSSTTDPHRPKDFLDPTEIKTFLNAAKSGRQGIRDYLLFLMMYRHGLRCSEAIDIRREDVSFDRATLWVRRLKGSNSGMHPIEGDELRQSGDTWRLGMIACLGYLSQNGNPSLVGSLLITWWIEQRSSLASTIYIHIAYGILAVTPWRIRELIYEPYKNGLAIGRLR